jgi:hypothetical protein
LLVASPAVLRALNRSGMPVDEFRNGQTPDGVGIDPAFEGEIVGGVF